MATDNVISPLRAGFRQTGTRVRGREWIKMPPERRLSENWIDRSMWHTRAVSIVRAQLPALDHILHAINSSRYILELGEDWDGEGAKPYNADTWERTTQFVRQYATHAWKKVGVSIPAPRILPGPNGSIDIHWKSQTHELLVNIPENSEELASFYGDDFGLVKIKGSFKPSTLNAGIICWLSEHC